MGTSSPPEKEQTEKIREIIFNIKNDIIVSDYFFDTTFYPEEIQCLSKTHWTPVSIAIQAARMLITSENTRVLDVGSGCGKFCIVASLSGPGKFVGIEIRPYLYEIAIRDREKVGANGIEFLLGDVSDLDWSKFDAFYFFNPFYENKMNHRRIDNSIVRNPKKFAQYIGMVKSKLLTCRPGTRVVTYHGYGGQLPDDYYSRQTLSIGTDKLELWIKE